MEKLEQERDALRGEVQRLLGEIQQLQVAGRLVMAEISAARAVLSGLRGRLIPPDEVLNALLDHHRQRALVEMEAQAAALRQQAQQHRGLHVVPAPPTGRPEEPRRVLVNPDRGETFEFQGKRYSMNEQVPPDVEAAMRAEAKKYADLGHLEAMIPEGEPEELDPDLCSGPP